MVLLQVVASDTGPTVTGVTTENLQQYLNELFQAVLEVPGPCRSSQSAAPFTSAVLPLQLTETGILAGSRSAGRSACNRCPQTEQLRAIRSNGKGRWMRSGSVQGDLAPDKVAVGVKCAGTVAEGCGRALLDVLWLAWTQATPGAPANAAAADAWIKGAVSEDGPVLRIVNLAKDLLAQQLVRRTTPQPAAQRHGGQTQPGSFPAQLPRRRRPGLGGMLLPRLPHMWAGGPAPAEALEAAEARLEQRSHHTAVDLRAHRVTAPSHFEHS